MCTINVAGFDEGDTKLELILQFIHDEGIDVMVSIDAQLHAKRKHWYGKIAKNELMSIRAFWTTVPGRLALLNESVASSLSGGISKGSVRT